jgi:hypothetical protein
MGSYGEPVTGRGSQLGSKLAKWISLDIWLFVKISYKYTQIQLMMELIYHTRKGCALMSAIYSSATCPCDKNPYEMTHYVCAKINLGGRAEVGSHGCEYARLYETVIKTDLTQ